MVVQNALNNLKDKPHDEKKAVASGVAISVVIILLLGWGFLFLRKIQKEGVTTFENTTLPRDQFNTTFLRDTQKDLNQMYKNSSDQLKEIRDTAAQNQIQRGGQNTQGIPAEEQEVQFGGQ